ncbi:hypothetical protein BGHDH14_bgh02433 [Blumeria hordei DH14]|uniref:Kinetochore protein n=1 Tax=Blumeria graminis f. sp. hordei (strain DH14) TaxID=546991 RepID=N1J9A6_BLUG1|nr:hypothetical protein BGHDH14_bgh02433 [Blumeria hordei DH14]
MNPRTPSILDLKALFLRQQISLLSKSLEPSSSFTDSTSSYTSSVDDETINHVMQKLNHLLRRHNRLAYGLRAQRHVAEQIDRLHWNAVVGDETVKRTEVWAERGCDYCADEIIEQLPDKWSSEPLETSNTYEHLRLRLVELSVQRKSMREKLAKAQALKCLVDVFGRDMVQGNLVTRDGELETELERMRRLMIRVERGVRRVKGKARGEGEEEADQDEVLDLEGDEEDKVSKLLL